ncbi:hypothetical protein [Synechocystis sp. LKSZ1]|uniref:hypothetical protein n=1 Tax=Synechocystis sp. LKSZ1 TaxID=3144951 RepID=UPI00336C024E
MTSPSLPETNPETLTDLPITAELVPEERSASLAVVENTLQATESIDYNFVNHSIPSSESSPSVRVKPLLTPWSLGGILCLIVANGLLTWQQVLPMASPPPSPPSLPSATAPLPNLNPLALNKLSELTPMVTRSPEPVTVAPAPPTPSLASLILPPSLQPQNTGLVATTLPPANLPPTMLPPARSLPTLALRSTYPPAPSNSTPLPPPPPPTLPAPVSALPPVNPLGTTPNLSNPPVNNPQGANLPYAATPPSVPEMNPVPNQPPVPSSSFNHRTRQTLIKQYNRGLEPSPAVPNNEAQQLIQELQNLNQTE